ncbi:MAG: DUF4235 domain-containing protein [Nocardioidaceae bacterium]
MAKKDKPKKPPKDKGKKLWKVMGTGAAVTAGMATTKVLDATWRTATGHNPPTKAEHPDLDKREAMAWAAVSGMAIGMAKAYATRRAADYWVKSTGKLPPGMSRDSHKVSKKQKKQRAAA